MSRLYKNSMNKILHAPIFNHHYLFMDVEGNAYIVKAVRREITRYRYFFRYSPPDYYILEEGVDWALIEYENLIKLDLAFIAVYDPEPKVRYIKAFDMFRDLLEYIGVDGNDIQPNRYHRLCNILADKMTELQNEYDEEDIWGEHYDGR